MNNEDVITIYTDGSFQIIEESYYIGMGLYIIHPDFNDIKIARAEQVFNKSHMSSAYAEMQAIHSLLQYLYMESQYYIGKTIYLYADSEKVVQVLNDPQSYGNIFKNKYTNFLKELNIKAYWVKGHLSEKGNFIVDSLAYNIIHTLSKDINENTVIHKNTALSKIFSPLLRTSPFYASPTNYIDFNKATHQRYMDSVNNNLCKFESQYFQEKIFLNKSENNEWHIVIEGNMNDDSFSVVDYDNDKLQDRTLIDIIKEITGNVNLVIESKKDKTVHSNITLYFTDNEIVDEIQNRLNLIKSLKDNNRGLDIEKFLKKDRLNRVLTAFFKKNRLYNIKHIEEELHV